MRARQGKLKSVKFGRRWMTTKEWIDEYIDEFGRSEDSSDMAKGDISIPDFSVSSRDNFIRNKNFNPSPVRSFVFPEIIKEASYRGKELTSEFAKGTLRLFAAAISVALALFFFGILFSASGGSVNSLATNLEASAASALDKFGRVTEINIDNGTQQNHINVENSNYECQCNCTNR